MNQQEIFAPHLRGPRTTSTIMGDVCLSLLPALAGALYFWGFRALLLTLTGAVSCTVSEYLWQKLTKKQITVGDLSAVVTGILLAFNLPVTTPVWVTAAAGVFSIVVVKQMFGGIGNNLVNPALMGRLLIMVVWPGTVLGNPLPKTMAVDQVSSATVLQNLKNTGGAGYSYWQMFLGEIPGALGETSKLLLLAGFGYLCYKGVVNAEATLVYLATVAAVTWIAGPQGWFTGDILANLLGGGLILGGCYMLTDYVYISRRGKILFAVAAGLITAAIRIFSPYPEGICLGILTANCLSGILAEYYKKKYHVYGVED